MELWRECGDVDYIHGLDSYSLDKDGLREFRDCVAIRYSAQITIDCGDYADIAVQRMRCSASDETRCASAPSTVSALTALWR